MSDGYISGDVAARLLKLTPRELDELVKEGVIPRESGNKYVLAVAVHSYIDHLRSNLQGKGWTQVDIANHLDVSERRLRDILGDLGLDHRTNTTDEIRTVYIRKLREEAAGRGDNSAVDVRKRKELAQARREELELSKELRLVINTNDLEPVLISLIKEIQSVTMEAGNKILQSIEADHDIQLHDDIVLGPLRSALGNIAGGGDKLISTFRQVPCASVSTAVVADGGVDREERQATGGE